MKRKNLAFQFGIDCWLDYECTLSSPTDSPRQLFCASLTKQFKLPFEPTEDMKFVFCGSDVVVVEKLGNVLAGRRSQVSETSPVYHVYRIDPEQQVRHFRLWLYHVNDDKEICDREIRSLVEQCGFVLMTSSDDPSAFEIRQQLKNTNESSFG